jgi:ribulose-phosphate 3-epimerase
MYNPHDYIERFIEAGADMLTIHFEATQEVEDCLQYIRRCNVKAGLAFRPETSKAMIPQFVDQCDMILLMTVNPGFGGQDFMPEVLDKIRFTRDLCSQAHVRSGGQQVAEQSAESALAPFDIQVDGGINDETARLCFEAGANVIVAGTHLFGQAEMKKGIDALRSMGGKHFKE